MSWILTHSGTVFDFGDMKPEMISIEDIAHSLAMQCRFTGHTRSFYSVAEHSCRMSRAVEHQMKLDLYWSPSQILEGALRALLHDASETYLTDIAKPIKPLLKNYAEIEEHVQAMIYERFRLAPESPVDSVIHQFDLVMLATERRDLMPPCGPDWEPIRGVEPMEIRIKPWPADSAEELFINRFTDIYERFIRMAEPSFAEVPTLQEG